MAERSAIMGPIWEGDGGFCIISLIISKLLSDIPWIYHRMDILKIVMISLIFALFYGPEPKHISKKFFLGAIGILIAASLLGDLIGLKFQGVI